MGAQLFTVHRSSSSIVVHSEQVLRFPPVEFDRATPLDPHATHALRPCEHSSLLDELIIGTPSAVAELGKVQWGAEQKL